MSALQTSTSWVSRLRLGVLAGFAGAAILLAALVRLPDLQLPIEGIGTKIEGTFAEGGAIPSKRTPLPGLQWWNSWAGSDDHRGTLEIGPFPAPARFGLFAAGYPRIGRNHVLLVNVASGETQPLALENLGESWTRVDVVPPDGWRGSPLSIRAVDDAAEWGGWIALSTPFTVPAWLGWWSEPIPRLVAFLLVGITVALWLNAAPLVLRILGADAGPLRTLLALAAAAFAGYLAFWAMFASPALGRIFVVASDVALLVVAARAGPRRIGDTGVVFLLMLATGVAYLATLHLYSASGSLSTLAQYRFGNLPTDNQLPQVFAEALWKGASPKALFGDWLSSDRPPLQTGWIFLSAWPALMAGVDFDTSAQCAGIWLQLLWIPAVWAWLRLRGIGIGAAAGIVAAIATSGCLVFNTTFVWPKLASGAFTLGAFTVWFLADAVTFPRTVRAVCGGLLAALAWLAHGGAAFALLALVPFVFVRRPFPGWRAWLLASVCFFAVVGPWLAYQRFYDPPGNRLLKWHLGGAIAIDGRGTWETLQQAYRGESPAAWVQGRRGNIEALLAGRWRELVTLSFHDVTFRRHMATTHTFFSLGWWNLGFVALPLAWMLRKKPPRPAPRARDGSGTTLLWVLLTLAGWVVLMFIPGSTIIHQGAYGPLIALFAATAAALWRLHPAAFLVVAALQIAEFTAVWLAPTPGGAATMLQPAALAALAFGLLLAIAAIVLAARGEGRREAAEPARTPGATAAG